MFHFERVLSALPLIGVSFFVYYFLKTTFCLCAENEEFDHEDVAYAMSVSLEEKERSSQENSFEKDGEGLEDNKDNKPQEEEEENEDAEEDVEDEEAMEEEEEEEAVEEVSCKVEQPDYPEEEDEEMEAE